MLKCYIMDVDGTVADLSHRRHFIQTKPKNWKAFHAGAVDDKPIDHMRPLIHSLWFIATVVFMSGRPESSRQLTQDWLKKHAFNISLEPAKLYMRPDGDYRDDSTIKLELLEKLRQDGYEPVMAFDDRDRVVKMWRENGIPCMQVAEGNF